MVVYIIFHCYKQPITKPVHIGWDVATHCTATVVSIT